MDDAGRGGRRQDDRAALGLGAVPAPGRRHRKGRGPPGAPLLADAKLHGHKYAIDAVLAVIARQQKGQVTVFTSDVDALEKLVPDTIVVKKV